MKAAFIQQTGAAETIEVGELPQPKPGPTDVVVKVEYAAVNHVDTFVRSGAYATQLNFPFPIGRDLVGTVVESAVEEFEPGQRVWSNSMGYDARSGSFAEYVAVPREQLFPVPEQVEDTRHIVAASHGFSTAFLALQRFGRIYPGETVLIGGAAGAVGSAGVQLAALAGARVVATASEGDFGYVRQLGAAEVIDYHRKDLFEALKAAAPDGYNHWWDNGGNHDFEQILPLLAPRGEIILSANMAARPELPVGATYTRAVTVRGFAMSVATVDDLAEAARTLNTLMAQRRLKSRWEKVFSLDDAAAAHAAQESGSVHGKILVKVS